MKSKRSQRLIRHALRVRLKQATNVILCGETKLQLLTFAEVQTLIDALDPDSSGDAKAVKPKTKDAALAKRKDRGVAP